MKIVLKIELNWKKIIETPSVNYNKSNKNLPYLLTYFDILWLGIEKQKERKTERKKNAKNKNEEENQYRDESTRTYRRSKMSIVVQNMPTA